MWSSDWPVLLNSGDRYATGCNFDAGSRNPKGLRCSAFSGKPPAGFYGLD